MKRVYFIKPIGMDGPVKIGCSKSPTGRRSTLAQWSPFPLEIVAEIEGDFDIEKRFHTLFLDSWERREWFAWSPKMQRVIDAINAGDFDIKTLPEPRPRPTGCRQNAGRNISLGIRVTRAEQRSGMSPPIMSWTAHRTGDPHRRVLLERFIEDPHKYGVKGREQAFADIQRLKEEGAV